MGITPTAFLFAPQLLPVLESGIHMELRAPLYKRLFSKYCFAHTAW